MLYHFTASSVVLRTISGQIIAGHAAYPELFPVTWSGFIGVEIFFVISGFVIAYTASAASPTRFLRSRILRLYPAAWISATLSAAVLLVMYVQPFNTLLRPYAASLTLFPFGPWIDSVYWTLGIEMAFYAAMFTLLLRRAFGRVEVFAYAIGAASTIYWIAGTLLFPAFLAHPQLGRVIDLSLIGYGLYFAIGILLFRIASVGVASTRVLAIGVFLIGAMLEIASKRAYNADQLFQRPELSVLTPEAIFLAGVAAIVVSLRWRVRDRVASLLRVVGIATYPLYLVHDTFGSLVLRATVDAGVGRYGALAIAIAASIGASITIALVLEPPLKRVVGSVFDNALARTATAAAQ